MLNMSEEKRIISDEKRYAIISRESVKLMADCGGHEDISEMVAGIIGEDVSYRLREIAQKGAQFMRHARRKRMTTEDFNKACRFSNIQPLHGYSSTDSHEGFHSVKLEQEEMIHFVSDSLVSLARESAIDVGVKHTGQTTIKAHWLAVEGIQKTSQNPQGTPGNKFDAGGVLMRYFEWITQAVLGNDMEMMKTALSDLRTNHNISPLLPHFVSFISNGVKSVVQDLLQLTRLLYLAHSLVCNNSLFLEAQPLLPMLVQSVQHCLVDPLTSCVHSDNHWSVRDYAARLLGKIVSLWGSPVNQLLRHTERSLQDVVCDLTRPFPCHYGAAMGLLFLGSQSIQRVLLPHLSVYMPHLLVAMEFQGSEFVQIQTTAFKVHGAILLCVECILRKYIREFCKENIKEDSKTSEGDRTLPEGEGVESKPFKQEPSSTSSSHSSSSSSSSSPAESPFHKNPVAFYTELEQYFGDTLAMRLPEILELKTHVFKRQERPLEVCISDPTAHKSGEELLEELVAEVKQEEKIKREKSLNIKTESETNAERRSAHRHQLKNPHFRRMQDTVHGTNNLAGAFLESTDVAGPNVQSLSAVTGPDVQSLSAVTGPNVQSLSAVPGQGIKLMFTKKSFLTQGSPLADILEHDFTELKDKGTSSKQKRKQSSMSPVPAGGFTQGSSGLMNSGDGNLWFVPKQRKKDT
ncbi:TAF6-like RNA polymerase II p300/CBP-associated factor-associated factor 65 kDa subunit 6L isoform X1 [Dreissena polymorpha]|uniref:TAF6-like RNA polymerase II p300/CBP-associated factor-associated factor 65 kDa subunit 6L isoform X1 n=1 Tax=Dreissena polymorpha TaxID=45954 RepID=UPI0022648AC2|nr:TAF6-like RNA polymerase II p300/CBP-associated factor-associated factor 65 kDa subunit 6L isoform X1 [Dreissena polymorpha]